MKNTRILVATVLLLSTVAYAQTPLAPIAEAMIRDGSNANVDMDEATIGYLMVKYSTAGSAGKSYFKFDFAGQNPNTNDALKLAFTTYSNNRQQRVQVWSLDQAYPAFTSSALVWNTAQANETNSNSMLTSGDFTATPLMEFTSPNSANAQVTVNLPSPWGQFLVGDELVLVLATLSDPNNQANGTRIARNSASLSFNPILGGSPPSIGAIPDITVMEGQASTNSLFTVDDPEDGPGALAPFVISSSNEAVVSSGSVVFGGTGANRTVAINPAGTSGTAVITLQVYDNTGNAALRTFNVTVLPLDYPPTVSSPAHTNTLLNTAVTVPFTISDVETPADALTVDAVVADYSSGVLASASCSGTGSNRFVTVTPAPGADGVGVVTLTVTDSGFNTANTSFAVMVLPGDNVVFSEHFDYPDASKLFDISAGFWVRRNSSPQGVNLLTGGSQQAFMRASSSADDGAARLVGAPYAVGSGALLYLKCRVSWIDDGSGLFPTNSNGGFVHLANNPTANSALTAEVSTITNNVPEGTFRLGLRDTAGVVQPNTSVDLLQPAPISPVYSIVARYDVDSGQSALWVDASSETAPSVVSQDVASPQDISYVGLRQDVGIGHFYLDDLQVVVITKPTLTGVTSPAGGTVDLYFTGGPGDATTSFEVERTASLSGTFDTVSAPITALGGNTFRATVPSSGDQGFYRVKRKPMTF